MSSDSSNRHRSWRLTTRQELVYALDEAISTFRRASAYEEAAPRAGETAETLERIATLAAELKDLLDPAKAENSYTSRLSKVGVAALFEACQQYGIDFGRLDIALIAEKLTPLPSAAARAAATVVNLHSPISETGQGTGSSMGRDPDLRILRADHGQISELPPFRHPKDKLGVAAIKALVRFGAVDDVLRPGAIKEISQWLDLVWEEACPGSSASWHAVLRARGKIAAMVRQEIASEKAWDEIMTHAEASSEKSGS